MPTESQALDRSVDQDHLAFDPVVCVVYKKPLSPDHGWFEQSPNSPHNKSNVAIHQAMLHKDCRCLDCPYLDCHHSDSSLRLKVGSQAWYSSQPEILGFLFTYRTLYPVFFAHIFDFYQ